MAHPQKRKKQQAKAKDPEKVAAKKARRIERQAREAAERERRERVRRLKQAGLGALGVVVVVAFAFFLFRIFFPSELEGVTAEPSKGREHVAAGTPVNYATATPTSGTHSVSSPRCGIYPTPLPLEFAVHALEHGVVVVWYQQQRQAEFEPALRRLVREFDDRVIVSPHPGLPDPIVATAWNRLKAYDTADAEISDFISIYRNRGPERIPCPVEQI